MKQIFLFFTLLVFGLTATAQTPGNALYVSGLFGWPKALTDINQYESGWPGQFQDENGHNEELNNLAGGGRIGWEFSPVFDMHLNFLTGTLGGYKRIDIFDDTGEQVYRRTESADGVLRTPAAFRRTSLSPREEHPGNYWDTEWEGNFRDYSLNTRIRPLGWMVKKKKKMSWVSPYASVGFGLSHFESIRKKLFSDTFVAQEGYDVIRENGVLTELRNGESTKEWFVPVAAGVDFRVAPRLDLGLELSKRFLNSDKLEANVSGDHDDAYAFLGATASYSFGKNKYAKHWFNQYDALQDEIDKKLANVGDVEGKLEDLVSDLDNLKGDVEELDGDVTGLKGDIETLKTTEKCTGDADRDGVLDCDDLEPNTPKGNMVNFQGVTIPKTAPAPAPTIIQQPAPAVVQGGSCGFETAVYFATNKTNISTEGYKKISEAAEFAKASGCTIVLVGHADVRGSESYNADLSSRRANQVMKVLTSEFKIASQQVSIEARGESESSANSAIFPADRRVTIRFR